MFIKSISKFLILSVWRGLYKGLDFIFPKNDALFIFSQSNSCYSDNARAFFESLQDRNSIWITETTEQHALIQKKFPNGSIVKRHSVKGFFLTLNARFKCITHGVGDLGLYRSVSCRSKIIQLWHGTPIKKMGQFIPDQNKKCKPTKREPYSLFVVASEIEKYYFTSSMNIDPNIISVVGLPRNDLLFNPRKLESPWASFKGKKIILYAPTYRSYSKMKFFPFTDFDADHLNQHLEKWDTILLLRPHKDDEEAHKKIITLSKSCKHIHLADVSILPDISDILPYINCLITDYSSIYIDTLLIDVPPIFIPYDLEIYNTYRGLGFDYDLVTPGPKVASYQELMSAIESALNGAPEFKEKRNFVKAMFHTNPNGNACQRLIAEIDRRF